MADKGEVKIRKMTDQDLARVNEIDQVLYGEQRVPTWPFSFEAYWGIYNPKLAFVAEVGGQVVGFLVGDIVQEEHSQSVFRLARTLGPLPRNQKIGWMDMIGIHPDFQRMNIGRKLIEAFVEQCQKNGAHVRGTVKEGDERLERFMKSLGFRKQEHIVYEK